MLVVTASARCSMGAGSIGAINEYSKLKRKKEKGRAKLMRSLDCVKVLTQLWGSGLGPCDGQGLLDRGCRHTV